MDIILYRGKTIAGDWVYGLPVYLSNTALSLSKPDGIQNESNLELVAIQPETLGKFINEFDMHRNRLFEGDHVRSYRAVYDSGVEPLGYATECYDTVKLRGNRYWLAHESFGYEREDLKSPSDFILVGNEFDGDGEQCNGDGHYADSREYYYIELTVDEYNALQLLRGA